MTQSEKHEWGKIRAKGRVRYIFVEGVLKRGILCGGLCTVFSCGVGMTLHVFRMTVWELLALAIFSTLIFGVALGALIWNLTEKNYQTPTTDDHVPGLQTKSKEELQEIERKILKRLGLRALSGLSVLAFAFGGLSVLPRSSPYRHYYIWGIIIGMLALFIIVMRFVIRGTKNDCYKLGAICPKCDKPLYSGSGVRDGRCPHCYYQLFE